MSTYYPNRNYYLISTEEKLWTYGFRKKEYNTFLLTFPVYKYKKGVNTLFGNIILFPSDKPNRYDIKIEVKTIEGDSYAPFYDSSYHKNYKVVLTEIYRNISFYLKRIGAKMKRK